VLIKNKTQNRIRKNKNTTRLSIHHKKPIKQRLKKIGKILIHMTPFLKAAKSLKNQKGDRTSM
jgi:hypothetical protein